MVGRSLGCCQCAWLAQPRAPAVRAAETDIRRDATVMAVEKVMPSVVNIATETIIRVRDPIEEFFRQFWDPYHRQPAAQFPVQPWLGGGH